MKSKDFLICDEEITEGSQELSCSACGHKVYAIDKWNFEKVNPICADCVPIDANLKVIFKKNQKKELMKKLDLTEKDVEALKIFTLNSIKEKINNKNYMAM